jgi:hypothetical protein
MANLAAWYEAMPGDPPADGGELHDQAAALLAQHKDGRLADVVDAPEVGFELRAEVGACGNAVVDVEPRVARLLAAMLTGMLAETGPKLPGRPAAG